MATYKEVLGASLFPGFAVRLGSVKLKAIFVCTSASVY
jgi:hypothetical protein